MAEEKKEKKEEGEKKEAPKSFIAEVSLGGFIMFLILLAAILKKYQDSGNPNPYIAVQNGIMNSSYYSLYSERVIAAGRLLIGSYLVFANILCLAFLVGLIYALIKMREVEEIWHSQVYPDDVEEQIKAPKNPKWQRVLEHINSSNPSDWRLSILEADIVLDDMLDHLGYIGDTISEKLKKAVSGDFKTLNNAWEAHKIRNAIAHEGSDFDLSQREAQRVIGLYQSVFQEFDYI